MGTVKLNNNLIKLTLITSLFLLGMLVSISLNVNAEESKSKNSTNDDINVVKEFYKTDDISLLKDKGFKVVKQYEGNYAVVKKGVSADISPQQAKELGFKVSDKELNGNKEDANVKVKEDEKSKGLTNNSLVNESNNSNNENIQDTKLESKELNWWAVIGIALTLLVFIGVLFIPTKKKKIKK